MLNRWARSIPFSALLALCLWWAPARAEEGPAPKDEKPQTPLAEAIALYNNRSYDKAGKKFDGIIKAEPRNPRARFYRGLVNVVKRRYPAALADFDVVVSVWPKASRIRIQRGRALMALNRWAEAKADFEKAVKLNPASPKSVFGLKEDMAQAEGLIASEKRLGVGKVIQDFRLMGASGKGFDLKEYKGKNYVVIVFYITWASPVCRDQLSQLNEFRDEFAKREAVVVTISTDKLKHGIELRENKGLVLPLLSDEKGRVVSAFGLRSARNPKQLLSLPAVFVMDRSGKVAYRRVAYDPRDRDGPEKLLQVLDGLIKKDRDAKKKKGSTSKG